MRTRRLVEWLGVIGTAARGAVFALVGVLVLQAAITYQPAKAGGIDKALLTLRNQPFGEFLLILAALGLIVFGVYGLCEGPVAQGLALADHRPFPHHCLGGHPLGGTADPAPAHRPAGPVPVPHHGNRLSRNARSWLIILRHCAYSRQPQ
jgi:hypothetical protein